jgi:diaminohydroxyphosphoribosylaminopyrimidine deaminase/5-amino-6-(5-phosphoribosylamino)uracil reductase
MGKGKTGTNPVVGAVIVKNGKVIGEGFHRYFGGDHAEIEALKNVTESVKGAEMYVTLEPCCHFGKTPPCTDAIIKAGISKICAAMEDPNPLMCGKGSEILRQAGIEVIAGPCEKEARRLNESYIKFVSTGLPFVTVKIAQTLDGKIADASGHSKWVSSEESRNSVYRLRSESDAVLIGANTARIDDPSLTTHGVGERNPMRLVLTRLGDLPSHLQLFTKKQ